MEWAAGIQRSVANAALPKTRAQPEGIPREGLEHEQLQAFYAAAECEAEPYRTMLCLLPRTGLRAGELCGLTVDRYDPDAREIVVTGKGGRTRRVPLTTVAHELLRAYLAKHVPPAPWLFYTPTGRPVSTRDLRRATHRIAERRPRELGKLSPHRCRHTTATELLSAGVNIKVIQDLLGHASIKSLDPYLHTNARQRRAALETLERGPPLIREAEEARHESVQRALRGCLP